MEAQKNAVTLVAKPTLTTRLKQAAIIGTGVALSNMAFAAGSLDATALTSELDNAKTIVIGIFGAGMVVLGLFVGWRYLKRGANSA